MARKRSKFGVDITEQGKQQRTYQGVTYDSKMEMEFYKEWIEPQIQSGDIIDCKRQVKYELQPSFVHEGKKILAVNYKSDFDITFSDGSFMVVDVKGRADNTALLKRKMFWYRFPDINYVWMQKSIIDGGWVTYETVKENRKKRKKEKKEK